MAQNLTLNPVAQDYLVSQGSPIPSDRVLEASYYALLIPQGQWLYGQDGQGSLIYTLQNQKRVSSIEQQFSAFAQSALQSQVIATGKASASQVNNIQALRTATQNQIEVIPENVQLTSQLNFNSV